MQYSRVVLVTGRAVVEHVSPTACRIPARAARTPCRPLTATLPDVGCSFWVQSRGEYSTTTNQGHEFSAGDRTEEITIVEEDETFDDPEWGQPVGEEQEDVMITQVTPEQPSTGSSSRSRLPTSIRKLNKMLSSQPTLTIPEHELDEKFVKGSGPGGQAINKTNSSVSLTHLPTGIRVQAQPTRSREQNRKVARRIMAERLDLLRASGEWDPRTGVYRPGNRGKGGSDDGEGSTAAMATRDDKDGGAMHGMAGKEKEGGVGGIWSKAELRWEKERRRKINRAKKTKRKKREGDAEEGRNNDAE